jgi:hypothetical protein
MMDEKKKRALYAIMRKNLKLTLRFIYPLYLPSSPNILPLFNSFALLPRSLASSHPCSFTLPVFLCPAVPLSRCPSILRIKIA